MSTLSCAGKLTRFEEMTLLIHTREMYRYVYASYTLASTVPGDSTHTVRELVEVFVASNLVVGFSI